MNIYDGLNQEQEEGVRQTEGPLLILAGAGSGKTRVLTVRTANLVDRCGVNPWNILAITFTNKAAKEMRERILNTVQSEASSIWVATFHATCVRILRRFADRIGYDSRFSIYDSDDARAVMKQIVKERQLETRFLKLRQFCSAVSNAKNCLISCDDYAQMISTNPDHPKLADAYRTYQEILKRDNAMDFDDLICNTVQLFRQDEEVLSYYQDRFRYIMVDEYQDTNNAQFAFVNLLAKKYRNLCVVGDDDQSIYRFRGANIRNILDFEKSYPDAKIIRLEQNYRSTQNILKAANHVIAHNTGRKVKSLWTQNEEGNQLRFDQEGTAYEEASFIVRDLVRQRGKGLSYKDFAVLYRTNAQSRLLEEAFVREGIPYRLIGGVNFYARREIKDILAYLKTVDNGRDELAITRIINVPKRGIGATTVAKVREYAQEKGISFFESLSAADEYLTGGTLKKVQNFLSLIRVLRTMEGEYSVSEFLKKLIDQTDMVAYLRSLDDEEASGEEEADRLSNVDELISKAVAYEENAEEATLAGFLEEVALVADLDDADEKDDRVLLMTLHSAKGLEFPVVYLAGMEEELFPSYLSANADEEDPDALEEERRLMYVGITRAKKELILTCARSRMVRGETRYHQVSRFVKEIPGDLLDRMPLSSPGMSQSFSQNFSQSAPYRVQRPAAGSYTGPVESKMSPSLHPLKKKPFSALSKGVPQVTTPSYRVGDRVRHVKFGEGTVKALDREARDYKVTVQFDQAGMKIMYAAFAKLQKI